MSSSFSHTKIKLFSLLEICHPRQHVANFSSTKTYTCRLSVTFWQNIFSIRSPVYKIVNSSQVHGSWTWALWPCTVVNIICYFCKIYKECDNFSMLVQSINWPPIERYESLGHKILTFCWVIPAQNTSLKLKCLKISNLDT